jgi:hypothetical protein
MKSKTEFAAACSASNLSLRILSFGMKMAGDEKTQRFE